MKPGESTNRGDMPARSPSPPIPRPSKVTKRPSKHEPSKLRNQVLQSELTPAGKVVVLNLLQEDTADGQTIPNASRPSVLRLKLRLLREPTVEKEAAGSSAPTTGHILKASGSSDDEAIQEAALILFNMKTVRPQVQLQRNREDILGNEIRQYEAHNRAVDAAQTLMSSRYIEPPHGLGAWKKTKFRLLTHENNDADASTRETVISDDGIEISDHPPKDSDDHPEDSLLEVTDDRSLFRGYRM